jgi:thiamine-monophosphate kinase
MMTIADNAEAGAELVGGEEEIVQGYLAPLARGFLGAFGLTDDCAVIAPEPGTELVLKTDPVAEGVHFLADDKPEDIAWKALAVNVADLAAKGAKPLAYLLSLSFPQAPARDWLTRFANGLEHAQERLACHLIGGDTDRRPGPLTVAVTAVGTVPRGRLVRRATARAGDVLFVSGTIGDAALGLRLRKDPALAQRWALSPAETEELCRRYARPEPRLGLASALRMYASAAMDLSDGLVKDLQRMCRASGAAARLRAQDVPLSVPARKVVAQDAETLKLLIAGGDDYEVLAAVPTACADDFVAAAVASGSAVTAIGEMLVGEPAVQVIASSGRPLELGAGGWDHFARVRGCNAR